jgi:hypothetical protein
MKTTTSNNNPLSAKSNTSLWLLQSFSAMRLLIHALTKTLKTRRQRLHANPVILAGLAALISSARVNARKYIGLICIGALGPLSILFYQVFDESVRVDGWYFVNNYYLFHSLGHHSFNWFFWAVGLYLLTPNSYSEYWTAPFIGYSIIKAALIVNVTSNDEWHQAMSWELYPAILLTGLCFTLGIKYFTWRKFHKHDGIVKRMDGLIQSPGLSTEQKILLVEHTWNEYKQFYKI